MAFTETLAAIEETTTAATTSQWADGGDVMKRIALAILLAFVAIGGTAAQWSDSSPTITSTDQAP